MNPWTCENWRKLCEKHPGRKQGLRLRFETEVDPELRSACLDFGRWLRRECWFPVRVIIYVKAKEKITACDGELVSGTCWWPLNYSEQPYIRVAAGDYTHMIEQSGQYNATASTLCTIAHELTHYYQWINNMEMTHRAEEWQASFYAKWITQEYLWDREEEQRLPDAFRKDMD